MIKPFFSIVTVTKNCQDTIIQTLKSVKTQTFDDYEHIIIDSFSEDRTYKLVQKFNSDKIIKKQIKDNSCFEGLNNAYKYISGKFIILLHSGDLLYSQQTLEIIKDNIQKKTDLLICNCIFFNKINRVKRIWNVSLKNLNQKNCYKIPHTATVMNAKLIEEIGDYNLSFKISSDTEYILRIFKKKNIKYIILNEFLCFMKLGGLSTSYRFMLKKIKEDLNIYFTIFGINKFMFLYLKKIFFKIKQYRNSKNKEIYNKNLSFLIKKIS